MSVTGRQSPVSSQQSSVGSPSQRSSVEITDALGRRVVIEQIRPSIDGGRFPIKRTCREPVDVTAVILADGHDVLAAVLRDRSTPGVGTRDSGFAETQTTNPDRIPNPESQIPNAWRETPMTLASPGTDEWTAAFTVRDQPGWHEYEIVAWVDRFLTWRRELRLKAAAGQDVSLELLVGALLVREAAARAERLRPARGASGKRGEAAPPSASEGGWGPASSEDDGAAHLAFLLERADVLSDSTPIDDRIRAAVDDELLTWMWLYADRSRATTSPILRVWVDRERARFGAWYEVFPRSAGPDPNRSGTFREAAGELVRIADLGFDVVYLPPIHPIGTSFRKGRNNSLVAGPGDPGSPWAIGSRAGGHTAVEPGLGTLDDFDWFRSEAARLGLEIALDLAWQASPDHPWVDEHPEWFRHRPDGTIKYAENPPKKYQDIYPFDFESEDWRALWQALLDVTLFWVDHGVKIFRVDNPHTKALGFWEWMIDQVHRRDPDVIFLSEAFTRPNLMKYLAKAGFTQSYSYFTWKNSKAEIVDYFTELTTTESREYMRPNLFANTPDILHAYLQHGGRPAFEARLLLASTLGANYGIYSGFELAEGRPVKPGSEEYADSEKYQYRKWDWDRPGHILELVARVNQIRRRHEALHHDRTLRFHDTDNPDIIAYSKTSPDGADAILTIVNLDPHHMQHGHVRVPVAESDEIYTVHDLIDDTTYDWRGSWNYVRFDPDIRQGHILWLSKPRT
jgi:starch synthase (maltosyl-transferring)